MKETPKQRYDKRLKALRSERSSWDSHWRELSDNFLPRRGRWLYNRVNRGDKRNQSIIDTTPRIAARTLQAGMMSGLTSPARPWFRLATPDPDMMEFAPVKEWLATVERRMRDVFAKSNLYNALPNIYGEMGVFGTGPAAIMEDPDDVIRLYPLTVGSYYLAQSDRLQVDTVYRELPMTVRNMVQKFGLDKVSDSVRQQYRNGNYEQWINVVHAVEPNTGRREQYIDNRNMPYVSVWYEAGGNSEELLSVSGFNEFPVVAPRWDTTADDVYGSSPGMDALGSAKALQFQHKRLAQLQDKLVNPPMVAPSSLKNQRTSLLPGDVTYQDIQSGMTGFQPAITVDSRSITEMRNSIQAEQNQINQAFYADLFLMLSLTQDHNRTAREVAELQEEKLLMLGPVLERLNDELLDPLVDRTFSIMLRKGLIPEPPEELQGENLRVEYISILAQAQKMVGLGSIDRVVGYAGNIAQFDPSIMDKIDLDQSMDEYGEMLGVPPSIIRSDDKVAAIRKQRAEQAAQQQAAENLPQTAQTAKTLSETDTAGDNALTRLVNG